MTSVAPFQELLSVDGKDYRYVPVGQMEGSDRLPFSLKVLLENVLRNVGDADEARRLAQRIVDAGCAGALLENVLRNVGDADEARRLAQRIVDAGCAGARGDEVEFMPARVLFQDFTGVPVFVDFAVMREACEALGGDPARINPQIPCDLVIDHSAPACPCSSTSPLCARRARPWAAILRASTRRFPATWSSTTPSSPMRPAARAAWTRTWRLSTGATPSATSF